MSQQPQTRGDNISAALRGRPKTEEHRAAIAEGVRRARAEVRTAVGYAAEIAELARKLVDRDPEAARALVRSALSNLNHVLAKHGTKDLATAHKAVAPATYRLKGDGGRGRVEAVVSVFDVVDLQGDRVVPGAFRKSIEEWERSGDPLPVIFSHLWTDPFAHIGHVTRMRETDRGLWVEYVLDDDNPTAQQVYKLLRERRIKEHSFAYEVIRERTADDGANELLELALVEIGPTLKGANPETELLSVKGAKGSAVAVPDRSEAVARRSHERAAADRKRAERARLDALNLPPGAEPTVLRLSPTFRNLADDPAEEARRDRELDRLASEREVREAERDRETMVWTPEGWLPE